MQVRCPRRLPIASQSPMPCWSMFQPAGAVCCFESADPRRDDQNQLWTSPVAALAHRLPDRGGVQPGQLRNHITTAACRRGGSSPTWGGGWAGMPEWDLARVSIFLPAWTLRLDFAHVANHGFLVIRAIGENLDSHHYETFFLPRTGIAESLHMPNATCRRI